MKLKDEIASKCSAELIASGDYQAIADAVNVGRVRATHTEIGNGKILETLGLATGNALLDLINTEPDFRHVKPLVEQGRLDISSALVQATVNSLVPTLLTQAEADALLALGYAPDIVSPALVASALTGGYDG